MGKKLYVGNLPFTTTDHELQAIFGSVGTVVTCKIIVDRESGRSKGFGFVEMSSDEEAHRAITDLNEINLGGRALRINEAQPPGSRPALRPPQNITQSGYEEDLSGFNRTPGNPRNDRRDRRERW